MAIETDTTSISHLHLFNKSINLSSTDPERRQQGNLIFGRRQTRPDQAPPVSWVTQVAHLPYLSLSFIKYFLSVMQRCSAIVCVCEPHLVYEYLDCMKYAGEAALQQCAAVMALLTITERGRMIYYRREEGGVLVSISASQPLTSVLLLRLRMLAMAVWGKYRAKSQLLKDFILKWQPQCNDN